MNTTKHLIVIGIAFTLGACGAGVDDTLEKNNQNNTMNPAGPADVVIEQNNQNNTNTQANPVDSSTNQSTPNYELEPVAPANVGIGTFPNGIWEATGTRDVLFESPPTLGESYAGGMMITSTTMDIYEALRDDGAFNGNAPCYRPSTGFEWSIWPSEIGGIDGIAFVFDGSFESGMQRTLQHNDTDQDKIYYRYVGPVTTESAATFHQKYNTACTQ